MAFYRKSPEANDDLMRIWRYIAEDNRAVATQFIDRLHGTMGTLADMAKHWHILARGEPYKTFWRQTYPVWRSELYIDIPHTGIIQLGQGSPRATVTIHLENGRPMKVGSP